jgi:hypothetical protein
MKNCMRMFVAFSIGNLLACSEPPAAPEQPAPTPQAQSTAPAQISEANQGVLTDTQREGMNTANQVSGLLEEAEKKRREQMEAQGL